jgi:energy-coupling factor transport system substrate-specific component
VSWAASTFALLLASLVAGYAWYERARPTARMAAMVATMAGLAALGRVAFAPLPNIKPTTDIVVLTGFVLGGAPGFAVGATGALASNVIFGQGPWTPWQMAAWGLVGLRGAALGAATGRRVSRVPLALFCGAMGLVFGAIMDLSTFTTFSGGHTLAQYVAISGTSLGFNLAHAVGNVVFCLAFGPALVRALERFRARLHITWIPLEATRR